MAFSCNPLLLYWRSVAMVWGKRDVLPFLKSQMASNNGPIPWGSHIQIYFLQWNGCFSPCPLLPSLSIVFLINFHEALPLSLVHYVFVFGFSFVSFSPGDETRRLEGELSWRNSVLPAGVEFYRRMEFCYGKDSVYFTRITCPLLLPELGRFISWIFTVRSWWDSWK